MIMRRTLPPPLPLIRFSHVLSERLERHYWDWVSRRSLVLHASLFDGQRTYVQFSRCFGQSVINFWQLLFVIASPDVFKSQNSDTYIVFGEAKVRL